MFLLLLILFIPNLTKTELTPPPLPWTQTCRQAVLCNLVVGDLSREKGLYHKVPTFYKNAELIIEENPIDYQFDYEKLNEILSDEGITFDSPYGSEKQGINYRKLNERLSNLNVEYLTSNLTSHYHETSSFSGRKSSPPRQTKPPSRTTTQPRQTKPTTRRPPSSSPRQTQPPSRPTTPPRQTKPKRSARSLSQTTQHPYESIIHYKKQTNCYTNLTTCENEIAQILVPESCNWLAYPYMRYKCATIKEWPAVTKSYLRKDQTRCELLDECKQFDFYEQIGEKELPGDWKKRKSYLSAKQLEQDDTVQQQITKNANEIIRPATKPVSIPNFTAWTTCPASTYLSSYRVIHSPRGLTGLSLICTKLYNRTYIEQYVATTQTTSPDMTTTPLQSCPGFITGFKLNYYKPNTWIYYLKDIQGICSDDVEKELPGRSVDYEIDELRCPVGKAVCGVRVNFIKPYLNDLERMFAVELYCCEIAFDCDLKEEWVLVKEIDLTHGGGSSEATIQIPSGIKYNSKFPTTFNLTTQQVISNLKQLPPGTTDYKETPVTVALTPLYVNRVYVTVLKCPSIEIYTAQTPRIIKHVSTTECSARVKQEFLNLYEYQLQYLTLNNGVQLPFEGEELKYGNLSKLVTGLGQTFKNRFIDMDAYLVENGTFRYDTTDYTTLLSQEVGICRNKLTMDYYKVTTPNIKSHPLPPEPTHFYPDEFIPHTILRNTNYPNGQTVFIQLGKIGFDWKGNTIPIPSGQGYGAKYLNGLRTRYIIFGISKYTGVDWREQKNWIFSGQFKRIHNLTIPFMNTLKTYQLTLTDTQAAYTYYSGDIYYRLFDKDGKCAVSSGKGVECGVKLPFENILG